MEEDSATRDLETKAIGPLTVSDADLGEVTAIVNTLNVVDREGDVILPGAIADGSVVKISAYNHDVIYKDEAPVGKGVITIEGNRAVLRAKYFLATDRGRDAFATVKALGQDSEWSIGFPKRVKTAPMTEEWRAKGARRLVAGLVLLEASPVFLGANGQTWTVAAKAAADEEERSRLAAAEEAEKVIQRAIATKNAAASNAARLELEHFQRTMRRIRT